MTEIETLRGAGRARLNLVRDCKAEYERQLETLEELETIAESITPHLSKVPPSGSHRPKDDAWARLADQRSVVQEDLSYYLRVREELETELMTLIRKPSIRTAMLYRFINCLSIDEIAEKMKYDPRNVYYLIRSGKNIYLDWYVKKVLQHD